MDFDGDLIRGVKLPEADVRAKIEAHCHRLRS